MLADAIVEVTETGSSLRANRLRIIETLMESETQLIANKRAWADDWKRTKIETLSLMLNGAMAAQTQVGLMLNVRKADLDAVLGVLPALNSPTVSHLRDPEWVAVNTIVDQAHRARCCSEAEGRGRNGHCRVSAEQSGLVSSKRELPLAFVLHVVLMEPK